MQPLDRRIATAPRSPWPAEPIPIALVITDLDVGGAERALVALAVGLDRRRWRPTVINLSPTGALVEPIEAAGIEVVSLQADRRSPFRMLGRLVAVLRRVRPVLIQSFLFHANIASRLAAKLAGNPWVLGGLRVAEHEKRWHLRVDRLTTRLGLGSVCVSDGVRRFVEAEGWIAPGRLTVIPNGVDPTRFDRAVPWNRTSLGIPRDAALALFVGRLDHQKGVDILLDATRIVDELSPRVQVLVVGDGPLRDRLHDQARGMEGWVHWLGRRDDVAELIRGTDFLVLPSRWEGMPNVILEAMAARVAVVATRVEGSEDLVEPGRSGWLVPVGDGLALAQAMAEAASDRPRLARFGEAGRARVEAEFTPKRVLAAYQALWARVLGFEPVEG